MVIDDMMFSTNGFLPGYENWNIRDFEFMETQNVVDTCIFVHTIIITISIVNIINITNYYIYYRKYCYINLLYH